MIKQIYADNAATTAVSESVKKAIMPYIDSFGNPSSIYKIGREAQKVVEDCRQEIAKCFNAEPREIIFTSGGSESDNFAIKGAMETLKKKGKSHIITTNMEHHAVLNTCENLENQGFSVTYLPIDKDGYITAKQVEDAITSETGLVTVMFANNEIGTIQPIKEIGEFCKKHGIWFHTDAVQAVGNVPIDVKELNIDLLSASAHKIHGLKGVGFLFVKKGKLLQTLINGGEQEFGKRAGTENVMGIVSLAQAVKDATKDIEFRAKNITFNRDYLIENVLKTMPAVRLNGGKENRLPGNCSFSLFGCEGEALLLKLDEYGIQASSGSACTTGSLDPSHVLLALGLPHVVAHGSLRITINDQTSKEDIDYIINVLPKAVKWVRDLSPLWTKENLDEFKNYYLNTETEV